MAVYLASLEKLRTIRPRLRAIAPGHGHLIEDPMAKVDEYIAHRKAREAQVLDVLRKKRKATITELVDTIYTDIHEDLHEVAQRTVWAHLRKLAAEGAVKGEAFDEVWIAR
jgi:hypothetical protein